MSHLKCLGVLTKPNHNISSYSFNSSIHSCLNQALQDKIRDKGSKNCLLHQPKSREYFLALSSTDNMISEPNSLKMSC